uniref:ATP synthase F0 subunit 8 n=1 Tax=Spinolyprops cribricollis TaxID=2984372 RepID=A0A978D6F0_9CUCU|nr:ATP synthase F0 subunit 8 [Spinolyprops cribricollis]UYB79059.1 ATP synthase F0 subunit 8 [Spinolyprops cribricollis]
MSPLSWTTLMLYFIVILILINILNYFSFTSNPKLSKKLYISNFKAWKW